LAVSAVLALLFYERWRVARTADGWVRHSHLVRNHIHIVSARARDLQLGHHGFLITGDSESLEPYWLAVGKGYVPSSTPVESTALFDDVSILESLTVDNPRQQANTRRLRELVVAKVRFTDSALGLQRDSGSAHAAAFVRRGHQKRLADSIRVLVEAMARMEDSLLNERQDDAEEQLQHNSSLLYGTVAFFYLLGMLALWLALRSGAARRKAERNLGESNALLEAVIHGTDYAVFVADDHGLIRIFSEGAERMLGHKASDFVGRPVAEATRPLFLSEEIAARAARIVAQYGRPPEGVEIFTLPLHDDGPYGQEWTNVRADGARIRVAVSVWELKNPAGEPQGSVAIAREVTTVRRLEEDIRRSNALFNAVINSTDQAIIAVDLEGTMILYNPAAERMEGYQASEFLGKHTSFNTRRTMLRHEIEARAEKIRLEYGREADDVEVFTLPLKDDPPGGVQWTFVRKGGERYPVQMSVSEMRDARGAAIGYMAVIRDITAFKALEARLRESRARLQAVIDGIDYAIFATDADGILRLINRGTERILGYSVADLVGRPVTEMAARFADPAELRTRASRLAKHYGRKVSDMELISLALPDDGPFGQEWSHARPDGTSITLAFSVYTLFDDEGKPTGVVALARDVTQLKALERMKSEFISTVSHELRTPLTSIRGALGLVSGGAAGPVPAGMREMLAIAYRNSERLVHIINDILDIDKIESGRMNFQRTPLEVVQTLRHAIEANLPYGQKYGVSFVLGETPAGAWVLADPDRLMQVMSNLLSNAAKFSPAGSEVTVKAEEAGGKLRISVRDHGPGISESFRGRVFDKFAQAEGNDARKHEGTGLGLNITRKLVEAMDGRIGFDTRTAGGAASLSGTGTTFWFELPLAHEPSEAPSESPPSPRDRVLICEDDADVGKLLKILLERAGLSADVERTLAGAKERLARGGYAAMTLDLVLPDGSGLTWLRQLRQDPATRELPVIVISARAEEGRRELNGDAVGIIDWIAKPIDETRLSSALKTAVGAGGRPRILHVEDDADFRRILANSLRDSADWSGAATLREAETLLNGDRFDLVVLDIDLPDGSGLDLLERLKNAPGGPVPVLILSASETDNGVRYRVEAALVKSRLSEERIVETILAQIRKSSRMEGGPA
jgi:PAS domain S-box-containing protein